MASEQITVNEMKTIVALTLYGTGRDMKDYAVVEEFGATPEVLVTLWRLLCRHLTKNSQPHHMLWWMYLCKHYLTKLVMHKALQVSPLTAQKAMNPIKEAFLKIQTKVVSTTDASASKKLFFFLLLLLKRCVPRFVSKTD